MGGGLDRGHETVELALVVLVAGIAVQSLLALFMIAFYRLAGIRPTRLEKRRWVFIFGWLILLVVVDAALLAAGINFVAALAITMLVVGVPVVIASYTLRGRHWLFTLAPDETVMLEGRREAINAARDRPAFWLIFALLLILGPLISLTIVLVVAKV